MASFSDVTNEKSSVFEDDNYDPDLEARLYAEIYYSNDNYLQDYDTTEKNSINLATSSKSTSSVIESISKDKFFVDTNSGANYDLEKSSHASTTWVIGRGKKDARSELSQRFVGRTRVKQQRLLAHKDLWLPKVQPESQLRSCQSCVQNLEDVSLETRLDEAQTFSAAVRHAKESRKFSAQFGNKSVYDSNNLAVVDRSCESGNFSNRFRYGSKDSGNISTGSNIPNANDNFSIQLKRHTAVNNSNETENFSTQFGDSAINRGNISTGSNRPNFADDFSLRLRSGTTLNRFDQTENFSTQFGDGAINCGNISTGSNRPNLADDFSLRLRSGTTFNRSDQTEHFSTQFGDSSANCENIPALSNRSNSANDFFLQLRSGPIVNHCHPTNNADKSHSSNYEAGNNCLQLESDSSQVNHLFATFPSVTINDCNITTASNHSEISSSQFGKKNTDQNHRTILTRSKSARRRVRNADRTQHFVAESLETDFEGEGLFNSSLAHQVENFDCVSESELNDLFANVEINEDIYSRYNCSLQKVTKTAKKLAKAEKKKEAALQRRAERKQKRRLKKLKSRARCRNNADVTMDGKYKVVSKKNKSKMREIAPEPVDISSDSDDSILEVPVPPKTPPPIIQLQDSDDDLGDTDKSSKSPLKQARKINSDDSSTSCSDENDFSKNNESSVLSTRQESPKNSREIARKTSSNIQQECADDSGRSSKSRSKKGKKSAEGNREESSLILATDFSAQSFAEPIVDSGLTISQESSKNTIAISNNLECEDDSEKSSKNRSKKGKKSVEENRDGSAICRNSETDFITEPSAEPIVESRSEISRETPKKTKSIENFVATSNIQECEDDFGKSSKNRSKKGKKSAEEPREESTVYRVTETDFSTESAAETINKSSSTISQKISRETPKKAKNVEHSVTTPNIQECDDNTDKSVKNRQKKGKKSAEETREESAFSRNLEIDYLTESSAEPIVESSLTISQKISRETPKKGKNPENSVPISNIQEHDDDTDKSVKNRQKKVKKSAEETREESLVSQADFSTESLTEPIADFTPTITQKISRDTPKKTKHGENSIAPSNEQENEDDSVKSTKSRSKKCKKSVEEPREEISDSLVLESSSKDEESSASPNREAKLQKILRDAAKKSRSTEISASASNLEEGNLIINCTVIQKGASSLEEIKKMRATTNLIHAHSDDSMTESELNNWVNIDADQANSSRKDDEICSIASSIDGSLNAAQENRAFVTESSIANETRSAEDFLPLQTTSKSTETIFHAPIINSEATNSRKRQKASSTFKDFDVPAVPEKKAKSRQKTSRDQTMTEYFFKPMSEKLKAFYNDPWEGENLDVQDVQSRMPKNPNCWAILDADLRGPTSKKRRSCPRCKSDTHFGRRCPEKAKPPCCYMCGAKGHTESRCPNTICLTCGRKYATYRPTCGHCSQLHCTICNGTGHNCDNCPDLWRRYHNTTTATAPIIPKYASNIMKPVQNLSCCNCAKRGHDITTCRQLRWSQHFSTPMYVTSYTSGPMYEPSNILPVHQPIINDLTSDLSDKDQYLDEALTNASNELNPDSSQNEILEESNINLSIETIEIADDPPLIGPEISLPQARIIFRAGELDPLKTLGWHRTQKRLDTEKSIELAGILSGNVKPLFLLPWQQYLQFGVEIIHDTSAGTFITITCVTTRIFKEFDKIIWQWLSRTDAEKAYLVYDINPIDVSTDMREVVKFQLFTSRKVLAVVPLLKKIALADKILQQLAAKIMRTSQWKKNRRRLSAIRSQCESTANKRRQLITSLYHNKFVEKGDIILQRFRNLSQERLRKMEMGNNLAAREYFQLVYAYNEIFSFHQTKSLTQALEKAIAKFREENEAEAKTIDWNILGQFPPAEIQYPDEQSNFIAATGNEIQNNSAIDSLEESLPLLANSAENCAVNIDPQLAVESREFDESFSHDSQQVFAANSEISINESVANSAGGSSGILMQSLGKKARRNYRRFAKAAIQAAMKSNVPRLKKIAKVLKIKMKNCTILKHEIDSLQREISNDLRSRRGVDGKNLKPQKTRSKRRSKRNSKQQQQTQRQSKQQTHNNLGCDNNPANVKFVRNL